MKVFTTELRINRNVTSANDDLAAAQEKVMGLAGGGGAPDMLPEAIGGVIGATDGFAVRFAMQPVKEKDRQAWLRQPVDTHSAINHLGAHCAPGFGQGIAVAIDAIDHAQIERFRRFATSFTEWAKGFRADPLFPAIADQLTSVSMYQ